MASGEVRATTPRGVVIAMTFAWRVVFRLAKDLQPPCSVRRLYLHDDLRMCYRPPEYSHHIRRNHRAKGRLCHSRTAHHASLQLCAIFYYPAMSCSGHGIAAAEIGIRGHSRV